MEALPVSNPKQYQLRKGWVYLQHGMQLHGGGPHVREIRSSDGGKVTSNPFYAGLRMHAYTAKKGGRGDLMTSKKELSTWNTANMFPGQSAPDMVDKLLPKKFPNACG
jgi:hypothetical protein